MSGLREIWEWVQREVILNPKNDTLDEFEEISTIFEKDDRSALVDILGDDTPKFLDLLGSRLSELRDEPETDEDFTDLEQRLGVIESGIEDVFRRFGETLTNILGTPIRGLEGLLPK